MQIVSNIYHRFVFQFLMTPIYCQLQVSLEVRENNLPFMVLRLINDIYWK